MLPRVLLPATTALGTVLGDGRQMGMRYGCNVVMPNLSPADVRSKYALYNNKLSEGAECADNVNALKARISAIGYEIVVDRGDFQPL
jgi:biotin synthase